MPTPLLLDDDRLFSCRASRSLDRARTLRQRQGPADRQPARPHRSGLVRDKRAVRPTPTELLLAPDHYLYRMLYSQGVPLEALGVPARRRAGRGRSARGLARCSPHIITCSAARPRGSGSTMCSPRCSASTCASSRDAPTSTYDAIDAALAQPDFRPRALFERFNIEVLATTEAPLDTARASSGDPRTPAGTAA